MPAVKGMRYFFSYGLLALAMSCLSPAPLAAEGFCVSCKSPSKIYLCNVAPGAVSPSPQAAKFFCVVQLAKLHGHASCAVKNLHGLPCVGELRSLIYTGYTGPTLNSAAGTPQPTPPGSTPADPLKPQNKEPDTLIELTNQAVKQSGTQIKKAGEAVQTATQKTGDFVKDTANNAGKAVKDGVVTTGDTITNAVKKSFKCLTSLFGDC